MTKIVHIADTHIRNLKYHDVYNLQFKKLYKQIRKVKPDYICVVGDLMDNFVNISNEAKILAGVFLTELASISKVIIVYGNHECMKSNRLRTNSVKTVVELLNNPNITYLGESGFFEEENLIWVNYAHLDKHDKIDPWNNSNIIIPESVSSKPTVGLFHDPIYGSSSDLGMIFQSENHKHISYFDNNDYLLCGDIHKFQYLRTDKSAAYCSSTIQINHGETPNLHGFLEWTIRGKKDFDVKFHDIPNDFNYITLNIGKDYDYNNIDLDDDYITPESDINVLWKDYSACFTHDNESKIREYIKDKWNIENVKFIRRGIDTEITDVKSVNESINVLDPNEQRKIFKEFLEENKFQEDVIEQVLKIDDTINDKIIIETNNGIDFGIDKITLFNFKSYDEAEIDFKEMGFNKIIQVHGINAAGKSTILDAICYVLFNKTFGTSKKEKAGDARFINNKRELDETWVSAIIDINGEKYFIKRTTTRKWNRDHSEISSASTTMYYGKGEEEIEDGNLTEEQRKDTQKLIDETLGDFDSFVNKSFINGENLNSLLSMDRSVFIDGLIKDAGFDIFEQKLIEFKEYKKGILLTRKNIKIDETIINIETLGSDIEVLNNEVDVLKDIIDELEKDKKVVVIKKESQISKLEKIDSNIEKLDIADIDLSIELENDKIVKNNERLVLISNLKEDVKKYDSSIFETKQTLLSNLTQKISDIKLDVSVLDNKILSNKNNIILISNDINNITNNYVSDLKSTNQDYNLEISKVKEEFSNYINDYNNDINRKLSQTKINGEIETLTIDGKKLKKDNEEIEGSTVCVMCKRTLDGVDMVHIHEKIETNKSEMDILRNKIIELRPKVTELLNEHNDLTVITDNLKAREYSFDENVLKIYNNSKDKIKEFKDKIEANTRSIELIKENNLPGELITDLKPSFEKRSSISLVIDDINEEKNKKTSEINNKTDELDELKDEVKQLKEEKELIDKKKDKISLEPRIESEIEKSKIVIEKYNKQIEDYKSTLEKIENNKIINEEILLLNSEIDEFHIKIDEQLEYKQDKVSKIRLYQSQISELNKDIKEYNRQKSEDEILNTYMKCVHRDGLPSYLLKKSTHIINAELSKLLNDVEFIVFFDEDLNLKLSSKTRLDVSQNIIESSGMERTFTAITLKLALRKINNKSKPNLILLDEIMGKLVAESVDLFIQLLDSIKNYVDKVMIIEHTHPINFDVLIDVEKDDNDISSMKVSY